MSSITTNIIATGSGSVRVSATSKLSTNAVSSLRVKPFVAVNGSKYRRNAGKVLKAAETEEPVAEENAFTFSYSDAKKNNEYKSSDVEAALAFYFDGTGSQPIYDADFVSGMSEAIEDASFFEDVDNNEAYDADEFLAAGIPEAAPKKRRGGADDSEEVDETDDVAVAKSIEKEQELEEERILESNLEEMGLNVMDRMADEPKKGVWDWLGDDDEGEYEETAADVDNFPSASEILADVVNTNFEEYDPENREYMQFLLDDFDVDQELGEDQVPDDDIVAPTAVLSAEEAAEIDSIEIPAFDDSEIEQALALQVPNAPPVADDTSSDKEMEKFLASLKETNAKLEASTELVSEEEAKAMFAGQEDVAIELPVEGDSNDADDQETEKLFAAADMPINALEEKDLALYGPEDDEDREDLSLGTVLSDYKSLAELQEDVWTEESMPTSEELDGLDNLLSATSAYMDEETQRRGSQPQEEEVDAVSDLYQDFKIFDDTPDDDDDIVVENDDGENWVERIVELSRVTKVCKGGKQMGFRCTALVGNGDGKIGVGCDSGREVAIAVKRALVDARKNIIQVPLVGAGTVPHKVEARFKASRVVIVPAATGTGVIAGSSVKSVLELAGIQNVLAKRLGSRSLLNNARCTIKALSSLKTLQETARTRGVPFETLLLPRKS